MKDNRDWVKGAELNKNSLIEYKLSHQKKLCVMINEEQNSFVKQLYYKCTYYTVQIISHSVKFLQYFMDIFYLSKASASIKLGMAGRMHYVLLTTLFFSLSYPLFKK